MCYHQARLAHKVLWHVHEAMSNDLVRISIHNHVPFFSQQLSPFRSSDYWYSNEPEGDYSGRKLSVENINGRLIWVKPSLFTTLTIKA